MKMCTPKMKTTTGLWFSSRARFSLKLWHSLPRSRLRCVRDKEKNEKENLRMLLIPKNRSNPEHYTLGSWKRDSSLSSFFAQIWVPMYFYVPGEDWMQPYRWLTVFLSTGLADGIDCSPGDHRDYISLRMQDSGSAPCLHDWNHLPGTKPPRLTGLLRTSRVSYKNISGLDVEHHPQIINR